MRLARLWINSDTLYFNYTKSDGLFDGSQISNLITMQIYDSTDMVMLRAGITKRCPRTRHK